MISSLARQTNSKKMRDVFIELISNAVAAIEFEQPSDGGKLAIETQFDASKNRVCVSFHDNGYGVAEEDSRDIFMGFVTSKSEQLAGWIKNRLEAEIPAAPSQQLESQDLN